MKQIKLPNQNNNPYINQFNMLSGEKQKQVIEEMVNGFKQLFLKTWEAVEPVVKLYESWRECDSASCTKTSDAKECKKLNGHRS